MRFRKFAGLAAGALTAGVLSVPAIAVAADAPSASVAASFSCPYQTWTLAYTPTIEASYDGDQIKLDMGDFPGVVGPPPFVTVSKASATVTASIGGAAATFTGEHAVSPAKPLSSGFPMPDLTAPIPAAFNGGAVEISGLTMSMTAMGSATAITCSMTAPVSLDLPAPPLFNCAYQAWNLPYDPAVKLVQDGKNVTVSMDAFPAIVGPPPFVTVTKVVASATGTVGGKTVALSGTKVMDPATPMASGFAVPDMTATLPSGLPAGAMEISDLSFTATAMGGENVIPCTLSRALSFDVVATPEDPKPPVVAAAKTKSVTKAVYNKKAKKATITTTVKAGKKNATGKVTITVKKGKKVIAKKTVMLKKGKAKLVLKKGKLKAKGKYVVTAQYKGNTKFKKSSAKKTNFKVKK